MTKQEKIEELLREIQELITSSIELDHAYDEGDVHRYSNAVTNQTNTIISLLEKYVQ